MAVRKKNQEINSSRKIIWVWYLELSVQEVKFYLSIQLQMEMIKRTLLELAREAAKCQGDK